MWLPLTLLVFAGLVSADYDHGWKVGNEYTYLVRSRTLTSLNKLSNQYSGILQKALLTVQAKDGNTLGAKVWQGQHAKIHKELLNGWESEISDQVLELRDWPLSEKPFEIKIKHGVIRDLIVDKDVPTWEVNILKAIVSQLQVDTQGENAIKSNNMQIPNDEEPFGMFKAMEDSVGGKCEVLYDTTPLPPYMIQTKPELVPLPHLKGDGVHIDIMKTKNFSRCDQRMDYHFGIAGQSNWEPGTNDNGKFLSKSSSSRIIISGNLKRFTIQSSVTTNKMYVSPRFYDNQNGLVASRMNLTLRSLERIQDTIASPNNPESTGNLVYIFNNPFSDLEERRLNPSNMDSNQIRTSDSVSSVSSSEEMIKNGQNPGLRGSSSSSASSSSISSSEEHQFWQPKPTLEEAPQNPLLPNFIGYKGKFVGKSGEIDLVRATKELVLQIANELDDPSNIPTHETLDKFTILSSLIRLMSRRQIAEVEINMHISPNELKSNDKSQAVKQNAWAVLRDAVTQAGTGPALLTIKSWIEKRNVVGMEAAEIISRIPKNARAPTAQYIRAVFDMATSSQTKNENFLNSTAILAFAELVRYVQVNSASLHNRYPVHTFGRLVSKHDKTIVEEYIPALARELQNAIKDNNSLRIQTLIMALGSIAHPRILSVFEPYLEGKQPVSTLQRTLMVAALSKMTNIHPKLARSVLYRIYLNTMESHEVRCTAVFLLMKTNPPLSMLQRMAEFTNYDTNKHVNSAVKSTIKSLAGLTTTAAQELASKARAAQNLLNPSDYSYQFSRGAIIDIENKHQNVLHRTILNYIGSDDSLIPRSLYLGWFSSYGDFKVPPTELTAMISNIRPLVNMLQSWHQKKHPQAEKTMAEQIAEELNIVPEDPTPLEGNIMWNSKFESAFWPFDKNTLSKIPSTLTNHIMAMKNPRYFNLNKLMSYDVTLSFPTETGLPFTYTLRVPILYKLSGIGQVQMNNGINVNVKSDIRAVCSHKVQGRIGFVTPYDHQHYIAGVDANFQVYAPLRLALDVNQAKKNVQLKVLPLKGEERARLIHYSIIPYTSNHNILNLRPLLLEKNTQKVQPEEIQSKIKLLPAKQVSVFQLNLEAGKTNDEFWKLSEGDILSHSLLENDQYRQADLYSNVQQDSQKPLVLNVAYDSMTAQAGAENSQQWTPTVKAVEPSDKGGNSQQRRQQLLKEALKGIKLAKSHVLDIQVQLPCQSPTENTLTVAWSTSNVENKARTLAYWQINLPEQKLKYEVCTATQASSNVNPLLSYDETIKSRPKVDFDVDVRYGETCSSDQKINIKGQLTQSNEMKDKIKHARLVKACQEEMQQGNKNLQTCQDAANLARIMDEVRVSLDIQSEELRQAANLAVQFIGNTNFMNSEVQTSSPKNAGKNKIDIKAKLSDFDKAKVSVHTPAMDMRFKDVPVPDLGIIQQDVWRVNENTMLNKIEQSCVLDKTRAQTFDGKTYPLRLGNCWHVVMTTYAKLNPENRDEKLRTPENIRITILSKETESGQKEVRVILGDQEIKLVPTNSQLEAIVNGQNVQITQDSSYQEKQDDKVLFELFRLQDNSIGLASQKYELNLVYDGKRILIKANEIYRNTLRGLCGNFDGDVTNDFTAPQNCLLRKPEQFIATYALVNQQCEGESAQIVKQISQKDCLRQPTNRPSNVISDVDAGRISVESQKWGYHHGEKRNNQRSTIHRTQVIEVNDQICFTIRPVVACAPGFIPTEVKNKNYQFHCMERNQASLNMKKRVEKGANPDLSQKPISMSRPIDVPLACQA